MKTLKILVAVFAVLSIAAVAGADSYSVLHEFSGSDDANPVGDVIISGSTLYGMTSGDGTTGTIFKMNINGTGYSVLHTFAGGGADGGNPEGSLTLLGSTLYGMTCNGGDNDSGTVFKIDTDGNNFSLLHEFAGGGSDGARPYHSNLIVSGSTLYGVTTYGGDNNAGTIFQIDTAGNNFSLLHEFTAPTNQSCPFGGLVLSGSTFFGMSSGVDPEGMDDSNGSIYKIDIDGDNFSLVHQFAGGGNDGRFPAGGLILSEGMLYGMTLFGGDYNSGSVFKISEEGGDITLLHEFTEGMYPSSGSLTLIEGVLYGMTRAGVDPEEGDGTIFKVSIDGTGFALLHEFAGGANDGRSPRGSLVYSDNTLYGMTYYGGDANAGVVLGYELEGGGGDVPEPSTLLLLLPFIGLGLRKMRKGSSNKKIGEKLSS
jgi:uncharacterized repeat protein (TIGR03803 family)